MPVVFDLQAFGPANEEGHDDVHGGICRIGVVNVFDVGQLAIGVAACDMIYLRRDEGVAEIVGRHQKEATGLKVGGRSGEGREQIILCVHVADSIMNQDGGEFALQSNRAHVADNMLDAGIELLRMGKHRGGKVYGGGVKLAGQKG